MGLREYSDYFYMVAFWLLYSLLINSSSEFTILNDLDRVVFHPFGQGPQFRQGIFYTPDTSASEPTGETMAKVPRPPNAFILYRKDHHHHVKDANPGIHNNQICESISYTDNIHELTIYSCHPWPKMEWGVNRSSRSLPRPLKAGQARPFASVSGLSVSSTPPGAIEETYDERKEAQVDG